MTKPRRIEGRQFEKIWGSPRLEPWFPNSERKIGEVWFDEPDWPILIKFLFTTESLSVQVHPDDDQARVCRGKTEMWHILRADPGAKIALGLNRPVTQVELREAALDGSIMDMLRWIPAIPGDTWFVPAGAVHAIGAGIALCEVQQNSDITYRLYDYGRDRELHLDQGLAVVKAGFRATEIPPGRRELVRCPYFAVDSIEISGVSEIAAQPGRANVLVVNEGSGSLDGATFRLGEVWRLPDDGAILIEGSAKMLLVTY